MFPAPKEKHKQEKKDESPVMAIDQEQDSEVTTEIRIDEIDGGGTTCFMTVEIEKDVSQAEELPPETKR